MKSVRRILFVVKLPTAPSSAGAGKAIQLTKALGAKLEFLHVIDRPLLLDKRTLFEGAIAEIEDAMRSERLTELEPLATEARTAGVDVCVKLVWDYPLHEAVLRRAQSTGADLIITECLSGDNEPRALRLTDWELLRRSAAPVLLVKTDGLYHRPTVLAAVDPLRAFRKPANLDKRILDTGELVAHALRGSLHAVHAYVPVAALGIAAASVPTMTIEEMDREAVLSATRRLAAAVRPYGIRPARRHLVPKQPAHTIEQVARETHSSIVVMGILSRSGLKRFVVGNTAEDLLDALPCDALVIKPRDFAAAVPRRGRGVQLLSPRLRHRRSVRLAS